MNDAEKKLKTAKANIRKIYLFNAASSLELTASIFALYLLANGLSMTEVMVLEAAYMIISLLMEIPSGAIADTIGRKKALAGSMIMLSAAFVLFGTGHDFWTFFLANAIAAIGIAAWTGADSAIIYDTLKEAGKEREYGTIYGKAMTVSMFGLAAASLAGGFLRTIAGDRNIFFITAAAFGTATIFALILKEPKTEKKTKRNQSILKEYSDKLKGAVIFSATHTRIRSLIIYYSVFAATTQLAWFIIQPYYENSGLPKYFVGIAVFAYFGFAGLGYYIGERVTRRIKEKILTKTLLATAAASFIAMKFSGPVAGVVPIAAMSIVSGIRDTYISKEINKKTASKHRATVESAAEMGKGIIYSILALLFGKTTDMFGAENTLLVMGVILGAFLLYRPASDSDESTPHSH